jgi:glutamine synthetase adenylyltransferase
VTYIDKNSSRGDIRAEMPTPLYNGVSNLPFNVEFQDRVRQAITQHFHSEVFTMVSQLTAGGKLDRPLTEQIAELQGEKAAILGTRIGNLQSELLDPIISRVFSIEAAAGRIPSPPDILLESVHGPVEVQYLGPLAQAQTRLNKVRSIMTFNNLIEQIAQRNPTVIDVINSDEEARQLSDAVGYPVSCLRDPREIAKIREQRNKMQQQEREAEIAPKLARAAASLSKSPEAGSVMQQLVGGEGAVQ